LCYTCRASRLASHREGQDEREPGGRR
jgi:hypothetical protein